MSIKRLTRYAPQVQKESVIFNTGREKLVLEKVEIFVKIQILVLRIEKHLNIKVIVTKEMIDNVILKP